MMIERKIAARRDEGGIGRKEPPCRKRRAPHWLMWAWLALCLGLIPLSDALHGCLGAKDQIACRAASLKATQQELGVTRLPQAQ
jgi:hypothetical protein